MDEYTAPDLRSSRISLPSITTPSTLSTPWWTRGAFAVFGAGTGMPSSESEPSSSPEPTPSSLSCGNRSRSCLRRSSRARFAAVFLARRCAALPPPPGEAAAGEEFPFAFATPFALPAEVPAAARSGSESESLNLSRSSSLIARVSRCSPPGAPSTRLVEWRGPSRKISQLCATAAGAPRDGVIFYPPSSPRHNSRRGGCARTRERHRMSAITFTANVAKVRVAPAIRGRVRARAGARVAIRASAGEEGTRVASFDAGVKRVGAVVGSVAAATAAEPAFAAAHEVAEVSATSQTFTHVALQPGRPTIRVPLSTTTNLSPIH